MAAKPLDPKITEAIVTDWRVGQMSQRQLAETHKVSLGMVSKLCKGVEQDAAPIVNMGIQYGQALAGHGERIVNAIETAVEVAVKRHEWLNVQALKNVQGAMDDPCANQNDYRARADTILKAKETVLGKAPETQVNVQTNIQQPADRPKLTRAEWLELNEIG